MPTKKKKCEQCNQTSNDLQNLRYVPCAGGHITLSRRMDLCSVCIRDHQRYFEEMCRAAGLYMNA